MKQHITNKQLNELSEKGRKKLEKWLDERATMLGEQHPQVSIGQMIEFLGTNGLDMEIDIPHIMENHLCDKLWEAVKEILEK